MTVFDDNDVAVRRWVQQAHRRAGNNNVDGDGVPLDLGRDWDLAPSICRPSRPARTGAARPQHAPRSDGLEVNRPLTRPELNEAVRSLRYHFLGGAA
jgi:hypothetical protein